MFALLLALVFIRPGLPGHLLGKAEGPAWGHPLVKRDLSQIRADSLRVLVLRDPLSWEEHPGAVSGLEWELLERFAKHEKLKLKAIPVDHPDSMLLMSLMVAPAPDAPMCRCILPIACSTGRAESRSRASPPTMKTSSRPRAWAMLPDTGASR